MTFDPDPIYIRDGRVSTAAGVTSALDLALAFIEDDLGATVARHVARNLVTYLQRPGNQAQMSLFTSPDGAGSPTVQDAVGHITSHLDADLSTAPIARAVRISPRHLTRLFTTHLGYPPARFVRLARIDAAARLLETTGLPVSEIAGRCGFPSTEALRQTFVGRYGVAPSAYRARFVRRS